MSNSSQNVCNPGAKPTSHGNRTLRILQVGLAKSGNLWLYKILQGCLVQAGLPTQSFIQNQPIHKVAQDWNLSYDEQADIDVIDITNRGCFYRISSIFRHPILDFDHYVQETTHVWSHSSFCDHCRTVFPKFDRLVYIIRDPRDAALSHARFMLTPYMKTYYPNEFESVEEYLDERLESKLRRWVEHVAPYLEKGSKLNIHFVFYERFLHNFAEELDRLLDYLGLSLNAEARRAVQKAVTFQSMKQKDPEHVQKGKSGKWIDQMTEDQKHRSLAITRPLLDALDYPLDDTTEAIYPSTPANFSHEAMRAAIRQARLPYMTDKLKHEVRKMVSAIPL